MEKMTRDKIQEDLKIALKERKELDLGILRMLSSSLLNREKDKQYRLSKEGGEPGESVKLSEEEVIETIASETKKLKDALEMFEKGQREDLAQKTRKEIEILARYLPEQLPEEDIRTLVKEAISKTGASSVKEMGKVMAELMPKTKGRADASLVSKIVKESLQ